MNKKLTRNDMHFNKLRSDMSSLKNKCSSQGLLGNSVFCQGLCDLLLEGIKSYTRDEYFQTLNKIKSKKLAQLSPKEFIDLIEKNMKLIIQQHDDQLNNEVLSCGILIESAKTMLIQLNFIPQAEHVLSEMYIEFEALYSEYLEKKINEEAQLDISKKSLNKAEEANRISKKKLFSYWSNLIYGTSFISCFAHY